jgi:hypothetical protein
MLTHDRAEHLMRRAHVYKEQGTHGSWWTYDVYETEGPIRARFITTGTRKHWRSAFEAAVRWVYGAPNPSADELS